MSWWGGGEGEGDSLMKRSMILVFSLKDVNQRFCFTERDKTPPFLAVGKVSFRIHSNKTRATRYHYVIKIMIMMMMMMMMITNN